MPATPKPDQRLPRRRILRLRSDFLRIKEGGKRQVGRYLVCNYMSRPGQQRLAGFIVPKACGSAVERNRIRRRVREIYRKIQDRLPSDLQTVWIARKSSARADMTGMKADVESILARINLA